MSTPNGRPLDDPGIASRFRGLDKDIEQIRRELVKFPKPVTAGGGTGGWAWAQTDTVGSGSGWLFPASWNLFSGPDGDPVVLRQGVGSWLENRLGVDRAGFYTISAKVEATFTGPIPDIARFHLRGVADGSSGSSDRHAREIDVPVRSDGILRASLSISGRVDPSVYDGIMPKVYLPSAYAFTWGPRFYVSITRTG